jgi:RNA polymerase sigma-70 factor (ECF subfamily)
MSEAELIKESIAGNSLAQKQLYQIYSRKMMGVCLRYTSNYDEANDVLQDGFIKLFEKLGTYSGTGSFEGWMRRIFVNTALDAYRKNKQERQLLDIDDVGYFLSVKELVTDEMAAEDLMKILQKIPIGYRTVFNMFAIEGYSHKEIGEMLGITESTSKSQYSRARDFLKNILEKQGIKE